MAYTHVLVPGSKRAASQSAKLLGHANPHVKTEITLKLRRKKELPELVGRPVQLMTREQLAMDYGASSEDIASTAKVLDNLGLHVISSSAATRTVRVSGSISAVEQAFLVKLFNYSHENQTYMGRVGNVYLPAELQSIVQGVFGLDNRRVAYRKRRRTPPANAARVLSSVPSSWYVSSQLASYYNFPPGDGTGQTVGLLEFDGGYFEKDLQQFCDLAGLALPSVTPVSADGTATNTNNEAAGEVMLDVEVVAGVCPKAQIIPYFANWSEQGWVAALDYIIQDRANNPSVLSISWGLAEDTDIWTRQAMDQINESFKEAAYLGITVCVSSGDDGSSDAVEDGHAHVDFPAASPYVLAVGGTTIVDQGNRKFDITWKEGDGLRSDNHGSTGGGVSAFFQRPIWQTTLTVTSVNPGGIVGRCVPDVAANADWDASPYLLVVNGQAQPNGGTSAATPLWAALIARMNQSRHGNRVGFLSPLLYQNAGNGNGASTIGGTGCTDVTTGNNTTDAIGGYSAGPGYDAVTGWGVPDGAKLLPLIPQTQLPVRTEQS